MRTFALALLAVGAAITGYRYYQQHTRHVFRRPPESFTARLFEPASTVYGSSIHVWAYQDDEGVTEIALTGHADSPTCRQMSGLVGSAYMGKTDDSSDLFVAGAARLTAGALSAGPMEPTLVRYRETLEEYYQDAGVLGIVNRRATDGAAGESAIQQARRRVEDDKKQLEQMERAPLVLRYAGVLKSRRALDEFTREAANVAKDSGLVQVHSLPEELAAEVRERIQKAVSAKVAVVVRFDDLLKKWRVPAAVMLVDVQRVASGEPLVLRVPLNDLSPDGFEEARKLNRTDEESSMVGDAERRRRFYREQEDNYEKELGQCRQIAPAELDKSMTLNQECTQDGICTELTTKEAITRRQYCAVTIPRNIAIVKSWMGGVDRILKEIKEDEALGEGSKVEAMNYAALVDSMLRDWSLPVAMSEGAFNYWRTRRRGPVWHAIDASLKKNGVSPEAIDGEQTIFSARVSGKELVIHVVHVMDLAHAVLVIDPKSDVSRIVDSWSERAPSFLDASEPAADYARQQASKALSAAQRGDLKGGQDALLSAVSADPATAFHVVEQTWNRLFRDDSSLRSQLAATKVKEISLRQERLAVIDEIFRSPELKEDDRAFVRGLAGAVEADPGLPVDVHMFLAMHVASILAQAIAPGAHGSTLTSWEVIQSLTGERTSAVPGAGDPLKGVSDRFEQYYDVDPVKSIKAAIAVIRSRDPGYLDEARRAQAMPKTESAEMRALSESHEVQIAEWDAAQMDGIQAQLNQRVHAQRAAEKLWSEKGARLADVIEELGKASRKDTGGTVPAFKSASERLTSFVSAGKKPDTLARQEIAQVIASGSRELLLRAKQRMKDPKTEYADLLSTHARLLARIKFEENLYAAAYEALFGDTSPVALYHSGLTWKTETDGVGVADSIKATCSGDSVEVRTVKGKDGLNVLRLSGMGSADACGLASAINQRWFPSEFGLLSEQVLVTPVPLRPEADHVRKLLVDDRIRLALLKAMVFLDIRPAEDLVSSGPTDAESTHEKPVISYRVPSLDEVAESARKRYLSAGN